MIYTILDIVGIRHPISRQGSGKNEGINSSQQEPSQAQRKIIIFRRMPGQLDKELVVCKSHQSHTIPECIFHLLPAPYMGLCLIMYVCVGGLSQTRETVCVCVSANNNAILRMYIPVVAKVVRRS